MRIKDIAADFGTSESCLTNWMTQADRDEGVHPGAITDEQVENRELRRRVRLLEQENEVPRRRVPVPGELAGEMMYPLVRDLADDGIPVTVTCRVLNIARQPYYRWLANPVTSGELD